MKELSTQTNSNLHPRKASDPLENEMPTVYSRTPEMQSAVLKLNTVVKPNTTVRAAFLTCSVKGLFPPFIKMGTNQIQVITVALCQQLFR